MLTIKILVVDDVETNRKIFSTLLNKLKIDFICENNGYNAVVSCSKTTFDMIFMDIQMPILSGEEAVKRIRMLGDKYSKTPIIAISSSESVCNHPSSLFTDFLTKPFTFQKIKEKINKYSIEINKNLVYKHTDESYIIGGFREQAIGKMILELCLERREAEGIIDSFFVDLPVKVKELYRFSEKLDFDNIKYIAHGLKGTAASLRLSELSELFKEYELVAKNKDEVGLHIQKRKLKGYGFF